jgi:RNA polymerase sigma factor (sigma-70 family)
MAAEWLARRACRLALRTATAILGSSDQAGDVAQDVAVDVLGSLERLRDPSAFDAWVHRITVRHALRAVGRRRGRARAETALDEIAGWAVPGPGYELTVMARELLRGGLSRLPIKQRLALALRYVHDLSDEEIAAALRCEPGTVRALLSRGRAALRQDRTLAQLSEVIAGGRR